jgi:hypothetical protein
MQPWKSPRSVRFISSGSRQLLFGPASSSCFEQMKVRSSTRATSAGSESTRKLPGRLAESSGRAVPPATSSRSISSYSSRLPSHQRTWSGWQSAWTSFTQAKRARFVVISVPSLRGQNGRMIIVAPCPGDVTFSGFVSQIE